MSDASELQREVESLRARNAGLEQQVADARQAFAALARGEVDAVANEASKTPILLREAQERLKRSEGLLRAIFDGSQDGILLTDDHGKCVDANPAACELFGAPRERLLGRSSVEFAALASGSEHIAQYLRGRGRARSMLPLQRPDGSRGTLDYSAVANVAPGIHLSMLRDVSDRAAAEESLRRSEARFRALTENSSDVISVVDRDGMIQYVSPSVARVLGWSAEDLIGSAPASYVHAEDRSRVAMELDHLASGAEESSFAFRAIHRDGSIRWLEATGRNLLADPDVRGLVGNFRDVTERRQAEEALRDSERLLEDAQAIAHVGSWVAGVQPDDAITWSREGYRIFGFPQGKPLTVAACLERVHPEDRPLIKHASLEALMSHAPYDVEHRIQRPDGSVRWVHERTIVERDAAGHPVRVIGTVQDVTDLELAMRALRASEADFRLLADAMPQIVWVTTPEGKNIYFNQQWVRYTGMTLEESAGDGWNEPFHPDDKRRAWDTWQAATASIGPYSLECRLRRADGAYLWWLIRGVPIQDRLGKVLKWFGTCTDIDAMKRNEETLRERKTLLRIAGEIARLGAWSMSLPDRRVTWSDELCAILEYSPGTTPTLEEALDLYPPEFRETVRTKLDSCARDGTAFDVEVQIATARRRRIWVRAIGNAERDAAGVIAVLRGGLQDVDDRRKLEDQFRQAQKMEAIGRLAGGVAHDFNNLLSVILSYTGLMLDDLKAGDPLRKDIEEIQTAGLRANTLTHQLLAFSRQQILEPRVVALNQIVDGLKPMLGRLLGEDIELRALTAKSVGRVFADPGQLEQVVMNLAVNARDAMPDGGRLTIETSDAPVDAAVTRRPPDIAPGLFVMLAVTDTGVGMDEATRARIFEPFFTTKAQGKGTGLGLATVFGIVQQSGGYVTVDSEPGEGSVFKVYLPRTDQVAGVSMTTSMGAPALLQGSETILLVEDEDQVRHVASTILRRHGYKVLDTSNGGEAFLVAGDFPDTIHLLLTDVVMPRMNGRKLAQQLTSQRPEMRVLYVSGYTDEAIIHHDVLEAGVFFLQKPFSPASLLKKVRDVLDARDSA